MAEKWAKKKVLVTGAGGFIGSQLVSGLVKAGADVRAFVRYNSRGDPGMLRSLAPEITKEVELSAGDLRDEDAVRAAVKGCERVFHLGALISIPYSYKHPAEVASTNLMGTLNVLLACRDYGIERLVHTSTSEVYGTARVAPINENHPLQGQSPYSASKIGADKLAESFYCAYDLPVITVRPFNTYGPGQSGRAVIPTIITQALTRDVIQLGNLETTRDFTYVEDTVAGFLRAAESADGLGEVFNLGTGEEIAIGELARKILAMTGRQAAIETKTQRLRPRKSEVMRLISDNTRAREVLGWIPRVSLEDGLKLTIEWISGHLDNYRIGQYEF
jgi:dTDP-glucose 4,6-dehydratase